MHDSTHPVERLPRRALQLLGALLLALAALPALAHKSSDAYLFLHGDELRVDVALRDLDVVLDIDTSGDARLSWAEVKAARARIEALVADAVVLDACRLQPRGFGLESRPDGSYAALRLHASCAAGATPAAAALRYTLFATVDPTHRGIARVQHDDGTIDVRLLDPRQPAHARAPQDAGAPAAGSAADAPALSLAAPAGAVLPDAITATAPPHSTTALPQPGATAAPPAAGAPFVVEGLRHILGGFDHVVFLLCLLLPAVMRRTQGRDGPAWEPVPRLGPALWSVAGMVTMFTLAHSLTLALAAFGLVTLPAALVEPAIAVTIIATAVDNIRPLLGRHRTAVTFLFGLIHGFGFAGVLAELQLPPAQFALALLQFNVGLELGQLAVVALALALLFLLRERPGYPRWVIRGGSAAALLVGVWWLAERVGVLDALPM